MKDNFWTIRDSIPEYRNLKKEERAVRYSVYDSFFSGAIDEAVMIYHEIYDSHGQGFKDDCQYQYLGCDIKEGDVVLDLGANIGIFTNFAADKGASKIYSFEPVLENFHMVMMNRPNQCEAHRLAISDKDNESVNISFLDGSGGGSICDFVREENKKERNQTVMTITLDTLIDNGIIESPDFIKMDIEGAEYEAFKGISDSNLSKVRCIAMEMHENVLGAKRVEEIYLRLQSLGFSNHTNKYDECYQVWFWRE